MCMYQASTPTIIYNSLATNQLLSCLPLSLFHHLSDDSLPLDFCKSILKNIFALFFLLRALTVAEACFCLHNSNNSQLILSVCNQYRVYFYLTLDFYLDATYASWSLSRKYRVFVVFFYTSLSYLRTLVTNGKCSMFYCKLNHPRLSINEMAFFTSFGIINKTNFHRKKKIRLINHEK